MKVATLLAPFATIATVNAKALLDVFGGPVVIGKTYNVGWLEDTHDHLELLLVKRNAHGWTAVETLFKHVKGKPPGGSYEWTVSDSITPAHGYALWLNSGDYADITTWFKIVAA